MRFVYGMFAGSFLASSFAVAVAGAVPLSVEGNPEFRREHNARQMAEFQRDRMADELRRANLLLDAYRRSTGDPVHPAGVDVPPADRIPAPTVPLPVNPTAAPGKE